MSIKNKNGLVNYHGVYNAKIISIPNLLQGNIASQRIAKMPKGGILIKMERTTLQSLLKTKLQIFIGNVMNAKMVIFNIKLMKQDPRILILHLITQKSEILMA